MCQCSRWKDGNKKGDNRAEDPHVDMDMHTHTHIHICILFFAPLPSSFLSNIQTCNVKSAANYLQGNYSTAGDEEPALLPQYRGLFSRSSPNQHTDCSSDWDQKKACFWHFPSCSRSAQLAFASRCSSSQAVSAHCTPDGIGKQQK